MDHLVFEVGTALLLVAIAALIANRIKFSIIPFLIVLGMIVGPHAPTIGIINLKFIESSEIIAFFGRMGVLFLLFYLGLEFSIGKLIKSGRSIAVAILGPLLTKESKRIFHILNKIFKWKKSETKQRG
ncbi:cation:proton antiporter domain-containing protein [Bacillus licheniformis]|uniref:cation:proton antiporter domain-containing protein n=1 Tax=Bacillus licheniformis TaxID=1402 RepID=UPI001385E844|nr:K(+)/H(+) antiporter YhaU [Bacillus licheniformis]